MNEISVVLDNDLARRLAVVAAQKGLSQTALIYEVLQRYLASNPAHAAPTRAFVSLGAGEDKTLDATRTHDFISQAWDKA